MIVDQSIFKAYDIRGIYPEQINAEMAYAIGQGYASYVKPTKPVAVGYDVRLHSHELQKEVIRGLIDAGVSVIDVGLISTEMVYFAVGHFGFGGGIQVTASHNPKEWHGMKFVRESVIPLSGDNGIKEIKEFVLKGERIVLGKKGTVEHQNILGDFCNYLLTWIDPKKLKPLTIVYNPNFGFAGKVLEQLVGLGKLPAAMIPLNAEPDGNFPKGRPDPFIPENRVEFAALVKEKKADLGVTWDADADRVFFCSDGGTFIEPYFTNAILIKALLAKYPGEKVLYDPRYAWALIDATAAAGGSSYLDRVGYVYIKRRMRQDNMVFSGESSGHTYFRDFWFSDSGMIPLLLVWELLSVENKTLSQLVKPIMQKYFISGELNFKTDKKTEIMAELEKAYSSTKIDHTDGITLESTDWRANVRASNTEPLLRLNVEARSQVKMEEKRDELVSFINQKS